MPSPRHELVTRNYRQRLREVRAETMRVLAAYYGRTMTEADIEASYAAFVPLGARTITAGQGAAQTLTRAYIRAASGEDPLPVASLAGTSKKGTITDALTGLAPFMLAAIAKGASPADAVNVTGAYFVDRLADNEMTRVVDREIDGQVHAKRVTGWLGIVNGPCDRCTGNAGPHSFDEEMYRHPGCECDRELIFEEFTYSVPAISFGASA